MLETPARRRYWSSLRGQGEGIRFLREHVRHDGEACLSWPLNRDTSGYGVVADHGTLRKASIVMCELAHGPKPTPKHIASFSCGRGSHGCVHPGHLKWRTHKETMQLAAARGTVGRRRDEGATVLTEPDIPQIKALRGRATYAEIGLLFGVKHKQIGRVMREEQWVGGKLGRRGFAPGDPRNPSARRARANHAGEDLVRLRRLIPFGMPRHQADDVLANMWEALFTGRATMEQLLAPGGLRPFVRQFYVANYEQGGRALAFDAHAFHLAADADLWVGR